MTLLGLSGTFAQGLPPGKVPPACGSKAWPADRQASSDRFIQTSGMRQDEPGTSLEAVAEQPAKRSRTKNDR
jgi:hypothetical protein